MVECQLPKLNVAGSSPVSRSISPIKTIDIFQYFWKFRSPTRECNLGAKRIMGHLYAQNYTGRGSGALSLPWRPSLNGETFPFRSSRRSAELCSQAGPLCMPAAVLPPSPGRFYAMRHRHPLPRRHSVNHDNCPAIHLKTDGGGFSRLSCGGHDRTT